MRAALLLLLLSTGAAHAQCGLNPILRWTLVSATPVAAVLPPVTEAQLLAGWSGVSYYDVTVQPIANNRLFPWFVCLQANAAQFPGPPGASKPATDLQWSLDGATWADVPMAMTRISGSYTGTRTLRLWVRARLRYDDRPGTYGPLPLTISGSY